MEAVRLECLLKFFNQTVLWVWHRRARVDPDSDDRLSRLVVVSPSSKPRASAAVVSVGPETVVWLSAAPCDASISGFSSGSILGSRMRSWRTFGFEGFTAQEKLAIMAKPRDRVLPAP